MRGAGFLSWLRNEKLFDFAVWLAVHQRVELSRPKSQACGRDFHAAAFPALQDINRLRLAERLQSLCSSRQLGIRQEQVEFRSEFLAPDFALLQFVEDNLDDFRSRRRRYFRDVVILL